MKQAGPLVHGTRQGYKRRCRCDECRAANADYTRAWRKRKREEKQKQEIAALLGIDPELLTGFGLAGALAGQAAAKGLMSGLKKWEEEQK